MTVIAELADMAASLFSRKGWIEAEEQEIYQYGCEVILSCLLNVLIVIVCGLVCRELPYALLFYAVFLILRRYCGGYHAKTYLKCSAAFTATTLLSMFLLKFFAYVSISFFIFAAVLSVIVVTAYSPIIHENKPLTEAEQKKYKKVSIVLTWMTACIGCLCYPLHKRIAFTMILALLAVTAAMLFEIIRKEVKIKSHGKENEYRS